MGKIVAIVGRPNVGKSTLFNRLTGTKEAIVDATEGVTRDRHYGTCEWTGKQFTVIDTGGYITNSDDVFEKEIRSQVQIAIDEADVLIFMVDTQTGVTDLDEAIADILRRTGKKVLLVSNKVDDSSKLLNTAEFYALGLGEVYPISAISGSGTGELLDEIVKDFPEHTEEEQDSDIPRFAVIGKPNVGKSSLINTLTGQERNIVTPIAGTTRDAVDTHYTAYGFNFILVDTAGLRKKTKVHENLEFYSVLRTIRSIEKSDVCLLLIDATEGFTSQDMNIFHLAQKNNKGIVIVVNKWDLVDKETNTALIFENQIKEKIAPFTDVPVIFTSVTRKQRIFKALEKALEVYQNRTRKIKTSELNEVLLPIINQNPPPATKGKYIKIKYITQLPTHAPAFAFFCNLPQYIKEPYKRFLENKIRERWNFTGVPLRLFFRKK
ncbi:MAG: ribosome biogenesis GTPase Der [Bacteroidetes bacterium]|nr:MAG: ribosome biogenesis GTPase Der [Bacteroidota bacterium]